MNIQEIPCRLRGHINLVFLGCTDRIVQTLSCPSVSSHQHGSQHTEIPKTSINKCREHHSNRRRKLQQQANPVRTFKRWPWGVSREEHIWHGARATALAGTPGMKLAIWKSWRTGCIVTYSSFLASQQLMNELTFKLSTCKAILA